MFGSVRSRASWCVLFSLLVLSLSTRAGSIVLSNDDWVLSDTGFAQRPVDTAKFANNLANLLVGNAGSIHAYSDFFAFTGSSLATALTNSGHTYTTGTDIVFDLPTISAFDALFMGLPTPTASQIGVLVAYVNNGGSLYIHAGNGINDPSLVPNAWNPFLNQFGLSLGNTFNGLSGDIPIVSSHPLFDGVSALHIVQGHIIEGCCGVATATNGTTLFAVSPVPAPGAVPSFLLGLIVLALVRFQPTLRGRSLLLLITSWRRSLRLRAAGS